MGLSCLKERDNIIFNVKWQSAGYLQRTHILGLKLPKMVKEEVAINERNMNTLWQGAMQKEMGLVKVIIQTIPKRELLQSVDVNDRIPVEERHALWGGRPYDQ